MIRTLKDGRTIRTGQDYKRFRLKLYNRAGGRCEMTDRDGVRCPKRAGFWDEPFGEIHHENGRGMGGSKRDDNPEVCLFVCRDCHRITHNTLHWSRNETREISEAESG